MESLVQFSIKWEIQLLVLLSFTLQMFLFFAGNLRRRSTSMLLRLSLWMTYLGADLVAFYALGFLSRHKDCTTGGDALRETHPLAFLWAPFLLVHLGGQDTITAFAMEDNNLWLRHLLNLAVQVVLALYVFWISVGKRNVQALVPGIFMFVVGIIKYGERTWALKCGSLKSLGESSGGDTGLEPPMTGGYSNLICTAQRSMEFVRGVFGERRVHSFSPRQIQGYLCAGRYFETPDQLPKLLEVELGMMYDDLYTKATVLRRKSGIILRCISQTSAMAALVVFLVSNKQRYSREDVAITYVLFAGSFFLEACAMFMFMKSPWTWARLVARKWHRLAGMSWRLLSSKIGWPEEGLLWSGYMGQLDINMEWVQQCQAPTSDEQARLSCKQRVMVWIRNLVGGKVGRLVWISKLIGTKYIKVDDRIMPCFCEEFLLILAEATGEPNAPRQWRNLGPSLEAIVNLISTASLAKCIGLLQVATESHLSKYSFPSADESVREMVDICHKVSSYMAYLLVTHPSTVPGGGRAEDVLVVHFEHSSLEDQLAALPTMIIPSNTVRQELSHIAQRFWNIRELPPSEEALEELVAMWIRLLIFVAAKSSPHMHAEHLGRGGELLTHLWLLLAHLGFVERIQLTNASPATPGYPVLGWIYAFYLREGSQTQNSETSVGAPLDQIV